MGYAFSLCVGAIEEGDDLGAVADDAGTEGRVSQTEIGRAHV